MNPMEVQPPWTAVLTDGQHSLVLFAVTAGALALLATLVRLRFSSAEVQGEYRTASLTANAVVALALASYVLVLVAVIGGYDRTAGGLGAERVRELRLGVPVHGLEHHRPAAHRRAAGREHRLHGRQPHARARGRHGARLRDDRAGLPRRLRRRRRQELHSARRLRGAERDLLRRARRAGRQHGGADPAAAPGAGPTLVPRRRAGPRDRVVRVPDRLRAAGHHSAAAAGR